MGQQQILLLVLSIVLVGIAVAVGMDAYMENRRKAEVDVMVTHLVRLASAAQEWKLRPEAYGGGANATGFEGVGSGFSKLGWPTVQRSVTTYNPDTRSNSRETTDCYQANPNTLYCAIPQISGRRGSGQLYIFGMSNLLRPTGTAFNSNDMNLIATAIVTGTKPDDIEVTVER